jgi:hypothetical protein
MYVQLYFVIQFLVLFCLQYFCSISIFCLLSVCVQFYLVQYRLKRRRRLVAIEKDINNYYLALCVCQQIMYGRQGITLVLLECEYVG